MVRKVSLLVLVLTLSFHLHAATAEKVTLAARIEGLKKQEGFLPWYWDEKKGVVLLELSPASLSREFLYFTALGSGIGSTEVFADRSSFSGNALCRFRRVGAQVLVIQENTAFFAKNGGSDLKQSVESSFPTSVLAALPIEAEQDGTLLLDATHLFIRDAVDLLSQLKRPTQVVGGAMAQSNAAQEDVIHPLRQELDLSKYNSGLKLIPEFAGTVVTSDARQTRGCQRHQIMSELY